MNLRLPAGYVEGKAAQAQAEARESFWAFRKNLRYRTMMLWGWWVELVAVELQQFYQDFVAGRRPRLAADGTTAAWKVVDRGRLHRLGQRQESRHQDDLRIVLGRAGCARQSGVAAHHSE